MNHCLKSVVSQEPISAIRVLLVKGYTNNTGTKYLCQPIGLMYLASSLRENFGFDVRILDLRVHRYNYDDLEQIIREFCPHVVGISALTYETFSMAAIAKRVKQINPEIFVLLGGPHACAYTESAACEPNVDYLIVGEGEITTGKLIRRIVSGGKDPSDIQGLAYRRNGQTILTGRAEIYNNLDDMPLPAYDLIAVNKYKEFDRFSHTGINDYMSIFTSRACPYKCTYCHNIFGKQYRSRSAKNIFNEIMLLHNTYDIHEFDILDDIFNLNRDRVIEFCELILESGIKAKFTFPSGLRGDILDAEQLRLLKKIGTTYIAWPIETGSPRIQKLIKKNLDIERLKRNIALGRKLGIHGNGFIMFGFPTETIEEMNMSADFIVSSKLHTYTPFMVQAFKGTELYDLAVRLQKKDASEDMSISWMTAQFQNLTDIPYRDINLLRRKTMFRFYCNPFRILAIIKDFPCKKKFYRLIFIFLRRTLRLSG